MLGGIILTASIMGGSYTGAVSNLTPVKSPFIFSAWRSAIMVIYFFIPAVVELIVRREELK